VVLSFEDVSWFFWPSFHSKNWAGTCLLFFLLLIKSVAKLLLSFLKKKIGMCYSISISWEKKASFASYGVYPSQCARTETMQNNLLGK